ncbi:hypothetical protein GCM10011490_11390 [Pseudoclavibacter endophyticus]|uniref:SRPBCC family protein n=1 Tax=Pseudoclavibacter endophyticus TaxID=1778590 RepID=A0A6H9WRN6_9MICO|nr:SRPBCC family protein [Pseudoclavibacter endophyticus]KAB1649435.1 SRPBCC family protein [Pseudoclavibacter endophyticus]GGA62677.1 hypothetical protein GCM10011490_11390 [Pseudoclavibacter endophyticus]
MPQLEASATVPLSPAEAFALAHSVGDERAAWDPSVATAKWLRGATGPSAGAALFTKSRNGRRRILRFELVDPDRLSSARLIKGQSQLADYGEGIRIEPVDGGSSITWKVVYKVRSPLAAPTVGRLLQPVFERELHSRLAAFVAAARGRAGTGQRPSRFDPDPSDD